MTKPLNPTSNLTEKLKVQTATVALDGLSFKAATYREETNAEKFSRELAETIAKTKKIIQGDSQLAHNNGRYYTDLAAQENDPEQKEKYYCEALIHLDVAIDLNPNKTWQHYDRAYVKHRLGNLQDAIKDFSKEIELSNDAPAQLRSHYEIHAVLSEDGKKYSPEAIIHLHKILELSKKYPDQLNSEVDLPLIQFSANELESIDSFYWRRVNDQSRSPQDRRADLKFMEEALLINTSQKTEYAEELLKNITEEISVNEVSKEPSASSLTSSAQYLHNSFGRIFFSMADDVLLYPGYNSEKDPQNMCVTTTNFGSTQNQLPIAQSTPSFLSKKVLEQNKDVIEDLLLVKSDNYESTALHLNIINHNYEEALDLLNTYPKRAAELLEAVDVNGKTPLSLALEAGAPEEFILRMLTPKTVLMADKLGVTPLMLASRGTGVQVIEKMLEMIPQDKIAESLSQTDFRGNSVFQWNIKSKDFINDRFSLFKIDGTKSENYCSNSLFRNGRYHFLYATGSQIISDPKQIAACFEEVGLEIGKNYLSETAYVSIAATKSNSERLLELATGQTADIIADREKLSLVLWKSNNPNSDFWQLIQKEMREVLTKISEVSLVDRYVSNQPLIREVLGRYHSQTIERKCYHSKSETPSATTTNTDYIKFDNNPQKTLQK